MNRDEITKNLREPFLFEAIDWKIQVTNSEGTKGMVVPYLNSRAIQDRLDSAVGAFNWKNIFQPWQNNAQICGISIYDEERKEWITKCDGAENTDFEPVKGGISDAFKRAAVHWGIGRYLYDLEGNLWLEVEKKGKSTYIKDSEKPKLKPFYERMLAGLGTGVKPTQSSVSGNSGQSGETKQNKQTTQHDQFPKPFNQTAQSPQANKTDSPLPNGTYKVIDIKNGSKNTKYIKFVGRDGEVVEAYAQPDIQNIGIGGLIQNIDLQQKKNDFKEFNVLNSYEKAAA